MILAFICRAALKFSAVFNRAQACPGAESAPYLGDARFEDVPPASHGDRRSSRRIAVHRPVLNLAAGHAQRAIDIKQISIEIHRDKAVAARP